jgi:hypothetical protein
MAFFQRKAGSLVLSNSKCGRFETGNRVAIIAITHCRSRRELPTVGIRFMAIRAFGEGNRLGEISADMTLVA